MVRKVFKGLAIGGALLAMVGTASADDIEINIYGASAQYKFWNAAASEFLGDQGCTSVVKAGDGKHGITMGTCGEDTVYIRYSSKASYAGIQALQGENYDETPECTDLYQREMASTTNITWGDEDEGVTEHECHTITIAASDVAADTFQQESHGNVWGHFTYDPSDSSVLNYSDDFYANSSTISAEGLDYERPIVVPFAFFANDNVPFDNMSRVMAGNLFAGLVGDWTDFGEYDVDEDGDIDEDDTLEVKVLLRHAGSGTHATLDASVMRGDYNLVTTQPLSFVNVDPEIWFYEGSTDLLEALADMGTNNGGGAVGYLDADKNGSDGNNKKTNVKRLTYNGVSPYRENIVNGLYSFYSEQWLYVDPAVINGTDVEDWFTDLVTFASDPENIELCGKEEFWAAQDEMKVEKSSDFAMPKMK